MYYRFSVDDNIWFLRDLNRGEYNSIFEHPYLSVYKKIHDKYDAKFQFNIYYETEGFCLSEMTDKYKAEWEANSSWLRLSFHAKADAPPCPYASSTYEEAFEDCSRAHNEIIRFAGESCLELYTTIHYCAASQKSVKAFRDCNIKGLVGLFANGNPSYELSFPDFTEPFKYDESKDIYYFTNDMIVNLFPANAVVSQLEKFKDKKFIEAMIHEQYFYSDYFMYQPDFAEKIELCIKHLTDAGRKSVFLSELIEYEK